MALTSDQLVAMYGSEYPDTVVLEGVRMPLAREGRFQRFYDNKEAKQGIVVSRFIDGTADISLDELRESWAGWSQPERSDFTGACGWLQDHPEFANMMRFVLDEGGQNDFRSVALEVVAALPVDEAFQRLSEILEKTPIGESANITQAIAMTKHADASVVLRKRLMGILEDPRLMEPDDFVNWVTYDAICGIEHLLELGLPASEFEKDVRRLSAHPSDGTIDSLLRSLPDYYPWLEN